MQKEVQICVVGKVFRPNKSKVLALNKTLSEYFKLVKWYLGYNSKSKRFLHEKCYEKAKELFNLNTALIQTARDKAVEIMKSFEENRKEGSVLKLKRISIRFDKRCYSFSKTNNALTPYWLTLSLSKKERISLPIVFGEKQRQRIEEALKGEWQFAAVEMVKRDGEWYAHFVLKKVVEVPDEPETVIAIDRGEHNLAVAVAISKENPSKPMKGNFWRGEEIKRIRGLYGHIRRRLQEKKLLKKVKELKGKERRKVDRQLHIIANQIVAYAKQFPKPVIVMEDLTGTGDNFDKSKELKRGFHSLPFRKLQEIVEYKALLEGIEVSYLTKKEVRNTSRTCHRCGHVAQVSGREFRCPKCGLIYNRDLNACINLARRLMRSAGWGSCEPPEPADEKRGVKPPLTPEAPGFSRGVTHLGGEAEVSIGDVVVKKRKPKRYRLKEIDEMLRIKRTRAEARLISMARRVGVPTPIILDVEDDTIVMERIYGIPVKECMSEEISREIGRLVAKLHSANIIHGDITPMNLIHSNGRIYFVDFGLAFVDSRIEAKGVDVHVYFEALKAGFENWENLRDAFVQGYLEFGSEEVLRRAKDIEERGRYVERS